MTKKWIARRVALVAGVAVLATVCLCSLPITIGASTVTVVLIDIFGSAPPKQPSQRSPERLRIDLDR